MENKEFKVGLYRRIFNKNLKDAIERSGLNYTLLREKTGIIETQLSMVVNFKLNPKEDWRVKLAVALETPIDELFPEKYDELYDRISPVLRNAEVKIDFLRLNSPEVLALQSPEKADLEAVEKETTRNVLYEIQSIPFKEARVIKMRYGLGEYDHPHTLEEVAKKSGVTRERIRQLEAKALERLRTNPGLKNYSDTPLV